MDLRNIIMATALCLGTSTVNAMNLEDFNNFRASNEIVAKIYLKGLAEGMNWSNTFIEFEGGKQLYCPPENLRLGHRDYMKILDSKMIEIQKHKHKEQPVGLLLLEALKITFPCK